MIDINKAEEWHSEIANLLRSEQLLDALKRMNDFSNEVADWNLRSELENMNTTYQSMLQCIRLGMEDPERAYMYRRLIGKGLVLNDRLYRALGIQIATAQYYRTIRDMRKHPAGNSLYDLPTWVKEQLDRQTADWHSDVPETVFNLLWTSDIWSPTDRENLVGMATGQIPEDIAAIAVSAATLGLIEMYDPQKYLYLFDIYQTHTSPMVRQRAIVGIALGCLVHDNRMHHNIDISLRVHEASEDPRFVKELQQAQMYLLRQRETEKINKFMNEEFLPEMMKNPILKSDKTGLDSLNVEDTLNPEWEKWIESKEVKNKMNIMNQLYTTGADIHMASFANMKNFPFFRQVCNWFIPFDHNHPAISDIITSNNGQGKDSSFFRLLIEGSEFCDSDCYSLFLFLANLPPSTREHMQQHVPAMNEEMREQLKEFHAGHNNTENLCKKYIQNIYRFYKLYAYRHEFTDIFTNEEMNLQYCNTLMPIVDNPDFVKEVALYLFTQKRYEEAEQMYSQLELLTEPQAEIQQKRGFCMQQLKHYEEAIYHYQKADIMRPSHLWTLTHMAQCMYAQGSIEEATEIYLQAEALAPDDLNLQLQTGNCLAQSERYDEAFKRFFKVHYLDEKSVTVWRAIAWYSLMAGRIEQAERFYDIIEHSDTHKVSEVDLLNIGHMHWLAGRTAKALQYYRKCCQIVGEEAFRKMMKADEDSLLTMDYPLMDLPIILDLMHT